MSPPTWLYWPAASAAWEPSDLTSLRAWYDADDAATIFDATTGGSLPSSGSDVARWEDKSGGGYHVTQATAANRPHYVTNTLNGKPVIECTAQWLTASTASDWNFLHNTTGSTVVAVWKAGTSADPNAPYALLGTTNDGGGSIGLQITYDDRANLGRNDTFRSVIGRGGTPLVVNNFTGNGGLPANTPAIVTVTSDPGSATAASRSGLRVNGAAAAESNTATGTASTSNASFPLALGSAGSDRLPLVGYIAEVVIADAMLSDPDRERVEGYLAHKWGLTASLPAGHPYKNSAP